MHGHIPALVSKIGPAVDVARAKMPGAADLDVVPEAIRANVFEAMGTMLRESDAVRERVEQGKTKMVGAVYDISTGTVAWLGPHPEQSRLIGQGESPLGPWRRVLEEGSGSRRAEPPEGGRGAFAGSVTVRRTAGVVRDGRGSVCTRRRDLQSFDRPLSLNR